ncbi:unnamed protein product [Notodromas monacha]|uniref:Uncharacterized protein n=1 Tax=Notodromas monacha TaxID=399045 RepID=A0A7R9BCZ5_9CRUS|nr:unnamed protein product [Notodromas monacha]CAG0912383.1 unnamed protein product [Notodromas monacha]
MTSIHFMVFLGLVVAISAMPMMNENGNPVPTSDDHTDSSEEMVDSSAPTGKEMVAMDVEETSSSNDAHTLQTPVAEPEPEPESSPEPVAPRENPEVSPEPVSHPDTSPGNASHTGDEGTSEPEPEPESEPEPEPKSEPEPETASQGKEMETAESEMHEMKVEARSGVVDPSSQVPDEESSAMDSNAMPMGDDAVIVEIAADKDMEPADSTHSVVSVLPETSKNMLPEETSKDDLNVDINVEQMDVVGEVLNSVGEESEPEPESAAEISSNARESGETEDMMNDTRASSDDRPFIRTKKNEAFINFKFGSDRARMRLTVEEGTGTYEVTTSNGKSRKAVFAVGENGEIMMVSSEELPSKLDESRKVVVTSGGVSMELILEADEKDDA